ncbi:hypothetical protein CBI38_33500 (plasmid) [Rhodococcus oxybenzonivorans]|uniref:Uncharacterized protein n=1 Tax=Rhodococcus oxybenzonivorans TaxID=1990687 RepID=A0A2S2C630_9NOCA|nr:hypothetical protein CBI38_33500 [Rhodococcus oxybenzonivorans]
MNGGMHQNEFESTDRHRQGSGAAATGESAKYLVDPLPITDYPVSADIMLTEPVGTPASDWRKRRSTS